MLIWIRDKLRQSAKKLQVRGVAVSLEAHWNRYELEVETLTDLTPLTVLAETKDNWRGIKEDQVLDPWKKPYFICSDESGNRQICSYGSDGVPGGSGDAVDFYLTDQSSWPGWLKPTKK